MHDVAPADASAIPSASLASTRSIRPRPELPPFRTHSYALPILPVRTRMSPLPAPERMSAPPAGASPRAVTHIVSASEPLVSPPKTRVL